MITDHRKRFASLQSMRERHHYGIPENVLRAFAYESPGESTDDAAVANIQPNPEDTLRYLTNIPKFDLKEDIDLGATPREELLQRYQDLQYREKWLKALLCITQDEITLFQDALNREDRT